MVHSILRALVNALETIAAAQPILFDWNLSIIEGKGSNVLNWAYWT